jgi:O-antigen ligase
MPAEHKGRFSTIFDPDSGPKTAHNSAIGRLEGFKAGIAMFKRFPLTGVGVGNFKPYRVEYVDGIYASPHNLVGQVLGETGLLGGTTFFFLFIGILVSYRRVWCLARGHSDPTFSVLSGLAFACRDSVILLFFEGLFGHNLRRFNWLWLAAFILLALQFAKSYLEESKAHKKYGN